MFSGPLEKNSNPSLHNPCAFQAILIHVFNPMGRHTGFDSICLQSTVTCLLVPTGREQEQEGHGNNTKTINNQIPRFYKMVTHTLHTHY